MVGGEDLDAGESRVGWHWPAFFVTTFWFIYRKMWLPGLLNFFWPVISFVIGAILVAVLGVPAGLVVYLLLLLAPSILLPMFANAIYRHHVHRRIADLRPDIAASAERRMARLERDGGTSAGAVAGAVAGGVFVYVFILGILAAIAIPAYQDYTIRAQVTEGLNLAASVKAAVTGSYIARGALPKDRRAAGLPPAATATSGKYVAAVDVAGGLITVTYGKEANAKLRGRTLVMTPFATPDRNVGWSCGYAQLPAGMRALIPDAARARAGTTIEPKYLPSACR
jgi:type IV pilus assembly protein PilA